MKKTSIVISSAEIIGNNPDLLTQIVIRIPTKPLLKFKCVSKQWLSLLSSPDFCFSHTRYHHQTNGGVLTPTALLLVWNNESKCHLVSLKHNSTVSLFDFMNTPNLTVLQSCNGLFLCKSLLEASHTTVIYKYFVCNPTTRKFKELSFPVIPEQDVYLYLFLAFDPLKSPHYKIFRFWEASPSSRTKYQLDIYSSETDSWSASRNCFNLERSLNSEGPVFCNGKLYLRHHGGTKLLCLDVENESMAPFQIALPINTLDLLKRIEIGECQGVLHVAVTNYYTSTDFELKVFEMKHDYSGWVLKHHLCIDRSVKGFYKLFQGHGRRWYYLRFYDVCITQVGKKEEPKIFVWIKNKVIFYDFKDGSWKFLGDFERKNHNYLFNYYENLSSV